MPTHSSLDSINEDSYSFRHTNNVQPNQDLKESLEKIQQISFDQPYNFPSKYQSSALNKQTTMQI